MKILANTWMGIAVLAVTGCYQGVEKGMADTDDAADAGEAAGSGASGVSGGEDTDGGGDSAGGDSAGSGPGSGGDGPPEGCIPGALGCECLDQACQGLAACVEGVCTAAPPTPEIQGPSAAIAGVAIILDGTVEVPDDNDGNAYEQVLWEQVEGPDAVVQYEYSEQAMAYLPGNAQPDATLTFRLSARLGEVTTAADYQVTVMAATPTGPMDEMTELVALGASVMAPSGNGNFWLGTATGTLVRSDNGTVGMTEELGSRIAAIRPIDNGLTLIALPDAGEVWQYNQNNNTVSAFVTQLSGGEPLGAVNSIAVDGDDNVYFGTDEGNVVMYDSPDDAEPAVTVNLFTLPQIPSSLALGQHPVPPDIDDGDEGQVLYFGTTTGDVMQVGLTAAEVIDGPEVGVVTSYIDVPGAGAVTGLTIDEFGNMWVGKSSTLYLVRRAYDTAPSVVRNIDGPAGLSGFAALQSQNGNEVSWIDPSSGRVARLQTYMN